MVMDIVEEKKYREELLYDKFNEKQVKFLIEQRNNYLDIKDNDFFDYDSWERDMWYTMNRSGLFEKDKENKTEIYDWGPNDTRAYISFQ